jgi:multiple sugar transport system permease protein/cellobiose transport system permease protein
MSQLATADSTALLAPRKPSLWREMRRNWVAYTYISPFFILFAIFGAFPILYSFVLSFQQWNGISPPQWIGFENYVRLFQDRLFWLAMWNTIFIGIIAHIPILGGAMLLAVIINSAAIRFKHFYRSAYFLPIVTSPVAISLVFGTLYGVRFGLINWVLTALGLAPIDWWGGAGQWIKPAIIILFIWRWMGWNMIIYLAGLQGINPELYEVAAIDGANQRQIFFKITLPLMRPIILFTLVTSTVGAMTIFDEPYLLVGGTGGTSNAGLTIAMYLYDRGFKLAHFGYASAMAYVVSALIVVVSMLNLRFFGRSNTEA